MGDMVRPEIESCSYCEEVDRIAAAIAQARADEREACAKVAEAMAGLPTTYYEPTFRSMISRAIRARGEA